MKFVFFNFSNIKLYNFFIHFSSIIFLKKFIKLNINMVTLIKNEKLVKLHMKYMTVFLNTQAFNRMQMFKLKERFLNVYKFSNHDNNKFFYCCKKVFILMNVWMIGKNSMKYHYLKKKIFTSHLKWYHKKKSQIFNKK